MIDESVKAKIYELEEAATKDYNDSPYLDEYLEGYRDGLHQAAKELSTAPTVDAVPVVRCCECKYRPHLRDAVDEDDAEELKQGYFDVSDLRFPTEGKCPCQVLDDEFYSWIPKDDWFCADGERRDTMFFTGFLTGMIVAFIVMGAVAFIFTLID